jgi:hypothetical protein
MDYDIGLVKRRRIISPDECYFAVPAPASTLDPATTAWVAAVLANGWSVSSGRQTTVNNLITCLKANGIWTQLDHLWILANENNIPARTDLVGLTLASVVGAPAFVTDRGYTGTDLVTATDYLNTGITPPGTTFLLNSCHVSAWSTTNVSAVNGGCLIGCGNTSATTETNLYDTFTDAMIYGRINDNPQSGAQGFGATRAGHWILSRTGASLSTIYQNGSSFTTPNASAGSSFAGSQTFAILSSHDTTNGFSSGTPNQVAMASIGGGLNSTDSTNFYNCLRTYMTAVGVP